MSVTGTSNPFSCTPAIYGTGNKILTLGTITRSTSTFTFATGFSWLISNATYQNATAVDIAIAPATVGFKRIDIVILTKFNTIELIQGVEDETVALQPVFDPEKTLLLTSIDIDGATIGDPVTPIIGDAFVKKIYAQTTDYNGSGENTSININNEGKSSIKLINSSLVSVSGFSLIASTEAFYDGIELLIFNNTGNDVTLNHQEASNPINVYLFKFISGTNLVFPNNSFIRVKLIDGAFVDVFKNWQIAGSSAFSGDGVALSWYKSQDDIDDTNSFINAIATLPNGGVIYGENGKTYIISSEIEVKPNILFRGNGATIKKANGIKSTLTSTLSLGANKINVENGSIFKVGQKVVVTNPNATYLGKAYGETSRNYNNVINKITAINGNELTITNTIALPEDGSLNVSGAYPIGSTVMTEFTMFNGDLLGNYNENIRFENWKIDGNHSNNNHNYDWRFNTLFSLRGKGCGFWKCTVSNVANEFNFCAGNFTIKDSRFTNMYGSIAHISNGFPNTHDHVVIDNVYVDGVCLSTVAKSGHNESAITYSLNSLGLKVTNSQFKNGAEAIFGTVVTDDNIVVFSNNTCRGFKLITNISAAFSDPNVSNARVSIHDNLFESCGNIIGAGSGNIVKNVKIHDNHFVNARIKFENIQNLFIEDNLFTYEPNLYGFTVFPTELGNAFMISAYGENIGIKNNNLRVDFGTSFDAVTSGIGVFPNGKTGSYVNSSKIVVEGNTVSGFMISIMSRTDKAFSVLDSAWRSLNIVNNKCYQKKYSQTTYTAGIVTDAGAIVKGNYIFTPNAEGFGIAIDSIETAGAINTLVNGANVTENQILGLGTKDIYLKGFNNIVKNNIINNDVYLDTPKVILLSVNQPIQSFLNPTGTKLYYLASGSKVIKEMSLSVAFDITTATLTGSTFSTTIDTNDTPLSIFFSSDGLKMFISFGGNSGKNIIRYNLSTAWTLSTVSSLVSFINTSSTNSIVNPYITFKPDGLKMFTINASTKIAQEFNLSVAWDLTTAVINANQYNVGAKATVYYCPIFSPDGLNMYISSNQKIFQWVLSSAWNVSTATFLKEYSLNNLDTVVKSAFINNNGSKLYVVTDTVDSICELLFNVSYDLSSLYTYNKNSIIENNNTRIIKSVPTFNY